MLLFLKRLENLRQWKAEFYVYCYILIWQRFKTFNKKVEHCWQHTIYLLCEYCISVTFRHDQVTSARTFKYPAQQSSNPHTDWLIGQLHRTLQNKRRTCGCTWDLRNKLPRFLNTSGKTEDERTVGNPAQASVTFQRVHSGQLQKKGASLLVMFLGWRGVNKIYNYTLHFCFPMQIHSY